MSSVAVVGDSPRPRRQYSRLRAGTLIAVYILMGAHIVHWRLNGTTLAPLELNEVMYTFELGVLTAGFIFMLVATVSVCIFGRFFCSWGCHILALEDLCAWLLGKIGIRPKPVRSRALMLLPLGAMFYMFIWPQLMKLAAGDPLPTLHVESADAWWGSFATDDFWRNLPGPWIAGLTFLICGFMIVYVLGSRSFCKYVCPYGAVFSIADRFAPGQIVARVAKEDCASCGACTAACSSHVRVHEELTVFGRVVNPACLKDLDCVSACPENAITYGFARPSLFNSWRRKGLRIPRSDFSWLEEGMITGSVIASILIFRGLYTVVPFLMTLGMAAILAYVGVMCLRLRMNESVRLNNFQLKRKGDITGPGGVFLVIAAVIGVFVLHSAFIRYNEYLGESEFGQIREAMQEGRQERAAMLIPQAINHFELSAQWGIYTPVGRLRQLASLHELSDHPARAEPWLRSLLERDAQDIEARVRLAYLLCSQVRIGEAEDALAMIDAQLRDAQLKEAQPRAKTNLATTTQRAAAVHLMLADSLKRLERLDEAQTQRTAAALLARLIHE